MILIARTARIVYEDWRFVAALLVVAFSFPLFSENEHNKGISTKRG